MTGILMVFEMTDNSVIMLPLMLSVVISHAVARRLEQDSLYSGWLRRRGERIEHGADRDVLTELKVGDAYERHPIVIPASATAQEFLQHLGGGTQDYFPVVDSKNRLLGVLSLADLGRLARDEREALGQIEAGEVVAQTHALMLEDSLLEAVRRMGARGASALPVVDPTDGRLLGLLSRSDVLGLYERMLAGAPREDARSEPSLTPKAPGPRPGAPPRADEGVYPGGGRRTALGGPEE
jgi:CIC family chloride channel protein